MYSIPHLDLPPLGHAAGTVQLPGSKSISNRLLLLAGLSEGTTTLVDLLDSDDTRVMLAALRTLGCAIVQDGRHTRITGFAGRPAVASAELFLGNAGTAMRPLTAALAVLATQQDGAAYTLGGVKRMHERPIGDLVDALRALGCTVACLGTEGYPPLRVAGGTLDLAAPVKVRGDVSSQFLTALLLALPLAATDRAVTIEVVGELISKPYIEITLNLLARFGIAVERQGWERFVIPAGSRYVTPGEVHVEGDASSASYFIALGAIAGVDAPVRIEGVGAASIQGDIRFKEAAEAMGAQVTAEPNALEIRRGAWPLKAIDLDCNHIPDAAMTLAVMALYADGPSTLRNIASWRVKETDRIAAMACELRKLGATVEEGEDFIRVEPLARFQPASIHTYDDHRMAMCLSLAAFNRLNPAGDGETAVPVRILDPKCVAKTFPDYFEALFSVVEARAADIPVITIDGPTASGKGTLSASVAAGLGWHTLDSGSLYRVTALAARRAGVSADDEPGLAATARAMQLRFEGVRVLLAGEDVSDQLRDEAVGMMASRISAWPAVRAALYDLQCGFRQLPGLVADGRDMGTVIFPDAGLKIFLTATAAARAERRLNQLIAKGISASLDDLRADLEARDERDRTRETAPLRPAEDALRLDNSQLGIEASVQQVVAWWNARQPFDAP
ncbi:3-phosphoshikimate 1-carboxyvinyltransferase/cytidine monophosphate kinase [Sphaerotilus natans subsp. natans DSM 6575]|uniref:Multifunctional fusion protein n=1 Tax=Sphaerotilus natans subsp. natans DSM 6575 TaxID=1286631 RepID=A0A059KPD9_9BURK|nr:bifunctional 3-phosphoshikimate 1-carboxyvinyltransferase/cytidylate kinase [Sphaerotilus natans]KDB53235.1 3-phosphoshikimate 1-carboxyvinyltransferase/cytidine monophosphate kinase [Sphaerotilus natans subsp. natans DSM 6575]SIQ04337.1 3-phosphoshikimate 1-carboxyvinyltransferase [Sphaerotilus natans]